MFFKISVLMLIAFTCAVLATDSCQEDPDGFQNEWTEELNFECPDKEVLSDIFSIHSNAVNDRKYRLSCSPAPSKATPGKCNWSDDFVNHWDEPVLFMCPENKVIAGVKSEFRKKSEDRRMRFKCCQDSSVLTASCDLTEYLNDFDEDLNFIVPNGRVLTGWFSMYSKKHGDRRHKMMGCRYRAAN